MNGLKTKKAHRNDVPFNWVFYIFFTYPGLRYDVHQPSAPPIIWRSMCKIGHSLKLYGKDSDYLIPDENGW